MIDSSYKNAFKEVYIILQNTENDLVNKIPLKFINFLKDNMNKDYICDIDTNVEINKQKILPETEDILSLIYRSYWATDEEKIQFSKNDRQWLIENEHNKKMQYKDLDDVFKERKNLNNISLDNSLVVIKKESLLKKFFKNLFNIFKSNKK